jgi:hypothetical protein
VMDFFNVTWRLEKLISGPGMFGVMLCRGKISAETTALDELRPAPWNEHTHTHSDYASVGVHKWQKSAERSKDLRRHTRSWHLTHLSLHGFYVGPHVGNLSLLLAELVLQLFKLSDSRLVLHFLSKSCNLLLKTGDQIHQSFRRRFI